MGHNLQALGTASLDTMAGLVTLADPKDVPEGASPRCWDVDFIVGSVFSRPGLRSVFTYATTLQITAYSLFSGDIATFTYTGAEPTINEGFTLSGFTGALSVMNGQTVIVESATMTQFTALVPSTFPLGNFTNITGSAISTSGVFAGPNVGSVASGSSWNSPNNISSTTGYASTQTGINGSPSSSPTHGVNQGSGTAWTTPQNVGSTGTSVTLNDSTSATDFANGTTFSVPANATINGISVSVTGVYTGSGTGSLSLQLATNGFPVGTPLSFALSGSPSVYVKGSSTYQWGTTFTPSTVNGNVLGVLMDAQTNGNGTFTVSHMTVTVYYTTAVVSGALLDEAFAFSISTTSGISGFGVTFKAYSVPVTPSAPTSVILQLLQAGIPIGTPKEVLLTGVPTIYSIGSPSDVWGTLWSAANVNSVQFGVQIIASGSGTTFIGDLDITTFITAALENFNYVGTYEQTNMDLTTLALDAAGNLWKENVLGNPGVLSLALTGILPNTFARGTTFDDKEFLTFSDLNIGTDRPRLLDVDGNFYPVTQVGPGAPPTFQAATGFIGAIIQLTNYSLSGNVITFTYTGTEPSAGALYVLKIASVPYLNGQVVEVLSSGLSPTQFEADFTHANDAGGAITGTATPTFAYNVASITQYPMYPHQPAGLGFLWSSAPGSQSPGTNVTVYYNIHGTPGDMNLINAFNANGVAYVEITGATQGATSFNGIWQVTGVGQGFFPGTSETLSYFTFTYPTAGHFFNGIAGSRYRQTLATLTVSTPIPGLVAGSQVTITGATPAGWNNTWTIVQAVNGGAYNITSTGYDYGTGIATYGWSFAGTTTNPPTAGNLITVIGCTNNAVFNGTFVIATVVGSTFTVNNITAPPGILPGQTVETQGQATEFGTVFTFDPGEKFVGTTTDVIYGDDSGTGQIAVIGSSLVPIGAGTRQAIAFFITESGNWTPASPPITFTVSSNANVLNVSNIPIGPPDVIARGIAITEAGANGVPGANFYVIVNPVVNTVGNVVTIYTSTIIRDNTSTTAQFSFTDAVLLNSLEVDVQGNNLFNLIELGSCAWSVPYSSRMFYGMQLNKVQNFNNLTFDGGYLPNSTGTILPLGWGSYPVANEITLVNSPVTGMALYISNTTGSIQPQMGLISQSAYQDAYKVAIIQPNTLYSVRVACSCPSGIRLGTLVIDLTDLSGSNFGNTYGTFSVPLSQMETTTSTFSGTLLINPFTSGVSSNLQLRVYVKNMGIGADILIDRIEVFPTLFPFLKTEVYGSYINKPESIDASGDGGIIDTSTENAQTCVGGFVMRDLLYLMKTSSFYSTRDNPNSEPGGWGLTEVSNRAGAIGINAFDTGDEWAVMANRTGIYGFNGGQPRRIMEEIFQVWDTINWDAGNTIVLRNDMQTRRMLCAIPLPTGTDPVTGVPTKSVKWLPFAPYNPAPTTPNVMLMLNYQAFASFDELVNSPEMHTTMFGTLAVQDMKRKWTIWQIPSPYMDFVTRANYNDQPLMICNGISSSKIYELDPDAHDDDGVAIYSLYTTYGFVNAAKAVTMPIFGMHAKRYTIFQCTAEGSGTMKTRMLPNSLDARYPYTIPIGINLEPTEQDDFFRPINVKGNRMFVEISTNAVGSWFQMHKMLLTGKADAWSTLNPTGGGNAGITT